MDWTGRMQKNNLNPLVALVLVTSLNGCCLMGWDQKRDAEDLNGFIGPYTEYTSFPDRKIKKLPVFWLFNKHMKFVQGITKKGPDGKSLNTPTVCVGVALLIPVNLVVGIFDIVTTIT